MPRAVLDTNVFLRGLLNPRSRCGRLLGEFTPLYTLVLSPAIIREILEVIQRPHLRRKYPPLARLEPAALLARFERAEVVEPEVVPAVCRDPDDDLFLACATEGRADFLVTEDKDLLDLGTHQGVRICRPAEFIERLGPGPDELPPVHESRATPPALEPPSSEALRKKRQ
jgi:putative PIN family toxin of toxin-antitoxin system